MRIQTYLRHTPFSANLLAARTLVHTHSHLARQRANTHESPLSRLVNQQRRKQPVYS